MALEWPELELPPINLYNVPVQNVDEPPRPKEPVSWDIQGTLPTPSDS